MKLRKVAKQPPVAAVPTSADVARLAGVSRSTISLVLNGRASTVRISLKTRERVLSAAAELGYTPNHAARSLRQRSTKIITFVLPSLENPYFLEIVSAAQAEAGARGYSVTIIPSRNELSEFRTALLLQGAAYDGIIVAGHDNCAAPELSTLAARGLAVVVLQEPSPAPRIHSVSVDLEAGDIWPPGIFLALVTDELLIPRRRCGRRVRAATGSTDIAVLCRRLVCLLTTILSSLPRTRYRVERRRSIVSWRFPTSQLRSLPTTTGLPLVRCTACAGAA